MRWDLQWSLTWTLAHPTLFQPCRMAAMLGDAIMLVKGFAADPGGRGDLPAAPGPRRGASVAVRAMQSTAAEQVGMVFGQVQVRRPLGSGRGPGLGGLGETRGNGQDTSRMTASL